MREACSLIWSALVLLFRSRSSLAAEILVLRHQIKHTETAFTPEADVQRHGPLDLCRAVSIGANVLNALAVLKPDTVIKWHPAGFRSYWRWKSRRRAWRRTLALEIRNLIRQRSIAHPL